MKSPQKSQHLHFLKPSGSRPNLPISKKSTKREVTNREFIYLKELSS